MIFKQKYFFSICLIVLLGGAQCHTPPGNSTAPSSGEPAPFSGVPLSEHQAPSAGAGPKDSASASAGNEHTASEHGGSTSGVSSTPDENTTVTDTVSVDSHSSDVNSPLQPRRLFGVEEPNVREIKRAAKEDSVLKKIKSEHPNTYRKIFNRSTFREMILAAYDSNRDDVKWPVLAFLSQQLPNDPAWDEKAYMHKPILEKGINSILGKLARQDTSPHKRASPKSEEPTLSLREALEERFKDMTPQQTYYYNDKLRIQLNLNQPDE